VLRSLLILAILIPGLAAALTSRFMGLLLYLWFALFRPMEWMAQDISALRPSLLVGLTLIVPSFLTGVFPYLAHPISIGSVLFLISGLLGQLNAPAPAIGWAWIDYLVRLLLVCLLAITIVSDPRKFKVTLAVVAGSLGVHAAKAGLVSLLGGGVRFFDGLAGAYADNNGYAVAMAMVAPLLYVAGQNFDNRWLRRGFMVAAPLTILAVISTFSRGGSLAVATATVTFVLVQRRRLPALLLIGALSVPIGMFMVSQEGYLDRLQTVRTFEQTNEESALSRLHFWRVATNIALANPLGIGFFNYEAAYDRYDTSFGAYGFNRSVHSSHFQVLAETGFFGFVVFEGLLIYACLCAFRIRRRGLHEGIPPEDARLFQTAGNAFLASIAAFTVGGAFVAMALNDLTWITFALLAALDRISAHVCAEADEKTKRSTSSPVLAYVPPTATGWRPVSPPEAV
jgi:probable O-glycosylation ligase (exosortase A-associated)